MRKNRNSFFAENNMNYQGYNPMVANAPYQNVSANSSFYSGQMPMMPMGLDSNEVSERLAKLERQISRLEHRISALEGNLTKTTDDFESTTNNMYII
ncbi:MAG: hypothetical protein IJO63_01180 [Bacilli bacterium]|nr:hypothetical protein [Bacilli bacterium]